MKRSLLRLPDDLFLAIKEIAELEHRSFNSQVIVFLSEKVKETKEHATADKKSKR